MATEPAFTFAAPVDNGLTPEQLQRKRMLAEALMQEGGKDAPIQSWTQGMARVTDSIMGGLGQRWANDKENYQRQTDTASLLGLPGPSGQAPPDSPMGYLGRALGMGGSKADEGMPPANVGTGPGPQAGATGDGAVPAQADAAPGVVPERMKAMLDKAGVPPEQQSFYANLAGKESSFDPNAVSPTGATGLFQFTKGTGRKYGLVGKGFDDRKDPEKNLAAAIRLTNDNRETLSRALGRDPSPGELALAHQQGAAGALALMSGKSVAPGNLSVNGIDPRTDPRIAARKIMAYYDGGGKHGQVVQAGQAPPEVAANAPADAAPPPPGAPPPIMPAAQAATPGPVSPPVAAGPMPPQAAPGPVAGGQQQAPLAPEANVYNGPGAPTASAGASDAPPQGMPPQPPPPPPPQLSPGAQSVASAQAGPAPQAPPPPLSPGAQQVAQAQMPELAEVPPLPDMNEAPPTVMQVMRDHPELRRLAPALMSPNPATQQAAMGQLQKYIDRQSPAGKMAIRQAIIESNKALVDQQETQGKIALQPGQGRLTDAQTQKALEDAKTEPLNRDKISAETDLTRAKIADMPNTDAIKNYDAYAAQEAAAGRQPKSREQLQLEMNRSGASTINTGAQTGVAEMVKESRATALAAAHGLTSLRNARQALQGGMVNGQFADEKLTLTKALKAFGAPVDDSAVVNAETFKSAIAPQIGAMVKAITGPTNISDGDRKFAVAAAGGDITLDGKSIARLLDIGERASMQVLKDHAELVQNAYPADSSDAEVQRFNRIFNVKEPEAPPALDSGPPGASTPSTATPAPAAATPPAGPKPGEEVEGYIFQGGNPADQKSWKKK